VAHCYEFGSKFFYSYAMLGIHHSKSLRYNSAHLSTIGSVSRDQLGDHTDGNRLSLNSDQ
jgi:isopenicillin N synthase-like dioxygenase